MFYFRFERNVVILNWKTLIEVTKSHYSYIDEKKFEKHKNLLLFAFEVWN